LPVIVGSTMMDSALASSSRGSTRLALSVLGVVFGEMRRAILCVLRREHGTALSLSLVLSLSLALGLGGVEPLSRRAKGMNEGGQ
jgi:hypothetical protein